MITLFPDQSELLGRLRSQMKTSKSVLLQSPTGSGKTALATHMIQAAQGKNKRIIFTVPRKDLLEQTGETFTKHGINFGFIAAGKPFNPYCKTYIGMVPTMASRLEKLPAADLLLNDETHFGSGSLEAIINHYKKNNAWLVGLSATPTKLSGEGLGKWYDTMVEGKSIQWLIENKRLSDYRYFHGKHSPDLSKISVKLGDYSKGELGDYMEEQRVIIGDCVNDYRTRAMGRLHIVRCASIKHSQITAQSFRDAGIPAIHVDGDTPMDERKKIFIAYARREILVLCFCDLLGLGFDLSQASGMDVCIESCSDLKPSKSLAAQLQFWGRVLRYKPYAALINDHVNNYIDHGLPCSNREWTLEGKIKKRGDVERVAPTRQCDECFHVHSPAPKCPLCGYVYEIKSRTIDEIEGELQEIDKAAIREQVKKTGHDILSGTELEKKDKNTLQFLIKKYTNEGHKNPAAKAAFVLASTMQKRGRL